MVAGRADLLFVHYVPTFLPGLFSYVLSVTSSQRVPRSHDGCEEFQASNGSDASRLLYDAHLALRMNAPLSSSDQHSSALVSKNLRAVLLLFKAIGE